ncbi:MAG: GNAT family N-acetyltransferase [Deltaproteobacteria bacterium]|nr:GNAT family N-acetyltransferase [Deltaproteobacteria bacterium]
MIEFLNVAEALQRRDLSWPDVAFSPGYGAVSEESDGGRWETAVGAGGRILSPYLLRPIPPELALGEELFDTSSPYGFGGTWVAPGVSVEEVAAFRASFRAAQKERGVVSEFQRLGGLLPGREALMAADNEADFIEHAETVGLLFEGDYDTFWAGAQGRHRTSVRKARKAGFRWSEAPATLQDLQTGGEFRTLYDATMRAVDAKPYYMFSARYYELLLAALGEGLRLAQVRDEGDQLVAAALFMRWGARLHYHLAGSERMAARAGANNLLLDGMIGWGFEHGIESLHLGGGITSGDALFKFKAQFGGTVIPFWLLRGVHDPERYRVLTARRAEQTGRTASELSSSGFFPAYRA